MCLIPSTKIPDGQLYLPLRRRWPTIALEAGYSETYRAIKRDMKLLIEGSQGDIGCVILVKIQPLSATGQSIQEGFVEVWKFDQATKKAVQYQER